MGGILAAVFPALNFSQQTGKPLYRQIYGALREAILTGQLRPGTRLPSTRSIARELGVSRNTVIMAFEQLLADGHAKGQIGSGTYVQRRRSNVTRDTSRPPAPVGEGDRRLSDCIRKSLALRPRSTPEGVGPFRPGLPALEHFPVDVWARLVAKHMRSVSRQLLSYGDPRGYMPLRNAIAEYVRTARAINCVPEQVLITAGSQQALHLAARVLLNPGDTVAIEDPGCPAARQVFESAAARILPLVVDEHGLVVEGALGKNQAVRAVYVTPSHQYPLGMAMSSPRRVQLMDCATHHGMWIFEHDYDSEYRYVSLPLPALQAIDTGQRVIYMGSFSKLLFPSLRLSYLIVPPDLVDPFTAARQECDLFSPTIHQSALAEFINEGHFTRHLRRMRMIYAERREALLRAIERELSHRLYVQHSECGIHMVALFRDRADDRSAVASMGAKGLISIPLSDCYAGKGTMTGLVLGFGSADARQIDDGIAKMVHALGIGLAKSTPANEVVETDLWTSQGSITNLLFLRSFRLAQDVAPRTRPAPD